jgi:branched-subunit amino acid aminotransferase/4-amino-4-deoxychorismate lyase
MIIYFNDSYVPVSPLQFERLLPGHLEGRGAFETMRLYGGRLFAFEEHMGRLACGLEHFGIRSPLSRRKIAAVIRALGRRNALANARVRVIVWRHTRVNISISVQKLALPKAAVYRAGFRVMSLRQKRKISAGPDVKSVDYRFFRSAFASAAKKGFDEVVFFNGKGHLVEGSRTNIFFAEDGVLCTPSLRCGCLNGITRRHVLACARRLGLTVKSVEADKKRLLRSDEAFLTGSTLEIMPIKSLDDQRIGRQRPGPLTARIKKQYAKLVKESLSGRQY